MAILALVASGSLLASAPLLAQAPARAAAGVDDGVRIAIQRPRPGETVRARFDMAPLEGVAQAGRRPTRFDVMLVLDVSDSTQYPCGIDLDGDGLRGREEPALVPGLADVKNSDPDDSILAAEVVAAKSLLAGLDPARVRVGVATFSGAFDPVSGRRLGGPHADARLEHALTSDYEAVRRTLDHVLARGPSGGTNMEAGIKVALRELAALSGAESQPVAGAKSVMLLLTDGKPSLPFGTADEEDPEDVEAVIAAGRLAHTASITINTYGLGRGAVNYPVATTEVARVTGGLYTPVRRPGDIVTMLTGVSFANVEDVVAVNLTLGEMAGPDDILLQPDGSFRGFVPVRPGRNRIRVSALASDGSRGSTELEILFAHEELSDAELEAERERIRERNRQLQLIVERKRQEAFRRRERQRMLEIVVEEDGAEEDEVEDDRGEQP